MKAHKTRGAHRKLWVTEVQGACGGEVGDKVKEPGSDQSMEGFICQVGAFGDWTILILENQFITYMQESLPSQAARIQGWVHWPNILKGLANKG